MQSNAWGMLYGSALSAGYALFAGYEFTFDASAGYVVSLGYLIADARTRMQHDRFVFLILLGALIVIAGDFVSAFARRVVRRAT